MNGCQYCVIVHGRKRIGQKRARGVPMCLAQDKMARCYITSNRRGPGCIVHDEKVSMREAKGKMWSSDIGQKYHCTACGTNAWAKLDTALICGTCMQPLEPV